jgi:hypothetical protein
MRKPQVFDLMSLTAGTIMHRSQQVFDLTPLIKWFWAIYMTTSAAYPPRVFRGSLMFRIRQRG